MKGDGNPQAGMGVDCGDLDGDGLLDLFVTNFSDDSNTYYHQERTPSGGRIFSDQTSLSRLGIKEAFSTLSWGTRMVDLDKDGYLDLVVASGHVYTQVESRQVGTTYAQINQVYLNQGKGEQGRISFKHWEPRAEDGFTKSAVSRGLATIDIDNDGDCDLIIVEMDAPPTLLRNDCETSNAWIGIHLIGASKNTDAIGARVIVTDSMGRIHQLERACGQSYLSSSEPRVLFGLGPIKGTVSVTVQWPGGKKVEYGERDLGQYHTLRQDQ
jgi:hypothetical protein